jgi:hypothetical protein
MKTVLPRKYWDGRCYNLAIRAWLLKKYAVPALWQVLAGVE